jgi:hypothetical protein
MGAVVAQHTSHRLARKVRGPHELWNVCAYLKVSGRKTPSGTNSKRRDGNPARRFRVERQPDYPLLLGQRPGSHPELIAPVMSPCRLGFLLFQRLLLTIADSLQAVRRDAETDQ